MENRCGLHLPWSLTAFYIHLMPNITFCFGKNSHLFCIQNLLDRKLLLMSWKTLVFVFLSVHFLLETSWFKNDGWKTKWICTHFSYSDGDYYYNSSNMQLLMSLKFHHPFNSVQLSHSVMCDSLWPRGLQHARPPCPSLTPRVYSNSCPLSQWCHLTISSSVIPFSCLQSFSASRSFQMSQFFASGGQSIGVSASASILPMNIQDWFPLGWTGWIFLQSKGLSRVFSNTTVQKHQFVSAQLSL